MTPPDDNSGEAPRMVMTVDEICERFMWAGLPCMAERNANEVHIRFEGHKSYLILTLNEMGRPLTAAMSDLTDYADFAHILFEVFDSLGWKFLA